jgi:hypothetical protein
LGEKLGTKLGFFSLGLSGSLTSLFGLSLSGAL